MKNELKTKNEKKMKNELKTKKIEQIKNRRCYNDLYNDINVDAIDILNRIDRKISIF